MSKRIAKPWKEAREELEASEFYKFMHISKREVPPQYKEIVYGLVDPRNDEVRYIGRTTCAARRYRDHINIKGRNSRLNEWIKELKRKHIPPKMVLLEESRIGEAYLREWSWIRTARREYGWRLYNK